MRLSGNTHLSSANKDIRQGRQTDRCAGGAFAVVLDCARGVASVDLDRVAVEAGDDVGVGQQGDAGLVLALVVDEREDVADAVQAGAFFVVGPSSSLSARPSSLCPVSTFLKLTDATAANTSKALICTQISQITQTR